MTPRYRASCYLIVMALMFAIGGAFASHFKHWPDSALLWCLASQCNGIASYLRRRSNSL